MRPNLRTLRVAVSVLLLACSAAATAQPLPETIPIFPLQDVMLFPHGFRPLHIFEPRYREMILHALVGDRMIGMVMLRPGHDEEYFGRPPVYPIGCAGVIENVEELPDGRYNIVLRGVAKFRVTSEDQSLSFRVANIETIPESMSDEERTELRARRAKLLEILTELAPAGGEPTPEQMPDEELVNGLAQFLRMEPEKRRELLEMESALARAKALIEIADRTKTHAASEPRSRDEVVAEVPP